MGVKAEVQELVGLGFYEFWEAFKSGWKPAGRRPLRVFAALFDVASLSQQHLKFGN